MLFSALVSAAQGDAPVLLIGDASVDKRALARALHEQIPRTAAPLVTLDCAAACVMPEECLDALARAAGGTLHLADVDALPSALQAALVDALQQQRPATQGNESSLAVRIVSSTTLDLKAHVEHGDFRLDLFEYLSGVVITAPEGLEPDAGPKVPAEVEGWLAELPLSYRAARDAVTDTFERHYLKRVLTETEGNIREAARRGQINRSYLMELLKKHGFR